MTAYPNNLNRLSKILSIIMILISLLLLCSIKYSGVRQSYCSFLSPVIYPPNKTSILLNSPADQSSNPASLKLYAKSACLIEASSGRTLYSKDSDTPLPMASTTKIMTCILALENSSENDIVTVSKYASGMPDVQLNINEGEQYKMGDLLYSLMLESHNDTAVAIAEHIGGSVEGFAAIMNQKALEIGCSNTSFVTPNGLDADGHHTTAHDLCLIASYALRNQRFIDITNTASHSFSDVSGKRNFTVNNKNLFLSSYKGALGIKTGFTGKAGYCFVGASKRNDMLLISSVLASGWPPNKSYKWSDTKQLMDYGYSSYSIQSFNKQLSLNPIPIIDTNGTCPCYTKAIPISKNISFTYPLCNSDSVTIKINTPDYIIPPVHKGDVIGSVSLCVKDTIINEEKIISTLTVEKYSYHDIINFVLEMFLI